MIFYKIVKEILTLKCLVMPCHKLLHCKSESGAGVGLCFEQQAAHPTISPCSQVCSWLCVTRGNQDSLSGLELRIPRKYACILSLPPFLSPAVLCNYWYSENRWANVYETLWTLRKINLRKPRLLSTVLLPLLLQFPWHCIFVNTSSNYLSTYNNSSGN